MPHTINERDFVKIPADHYDIGLTDDEVDLIADGSDLKREFIRNSSPRHTEFIGTVHISKRPVTCTEFGSFIRDTGYVTEAEAEGWGWVWIDGWVKKEGVSWRNPFGTGLDGLYLSEPDRMPVLQATWNDADRYCRWFGEKKGRMAKLPLEREWEAFGQILGVPCARETATQARITVSVDEYASGVAAASRTGDVFMPTLIWEWTDDWFEKYPGGKDDREFGHVYKILRGGSMMSNPAQRSREYRFRRCPTARSPFYCFRIAIPGGEE